ncbi:hypothetical protein H5410_034255 [Solanum commersonii]|uniref:Uncharacterized protein n=1 Tax=Solanum commersonii TaxID=4109 RepID=A0A9J5YSQ8_SOLCO|nr:hypothetical protein H5410_034255 [Solanum commersonii]
MFSPHYHKGEECSGSRTKPSSDHLHYHLVLIKLAQHIQNVPRQDDDDRQQSLPKHARLRRSVSSASALRSTPVPESSPLELELIREDWSWLTISEMGSARALTSAPFPFHLDPIIHVHSKKKKL